MSTSSSPTVVEKSRVRRALVSATVGTTIEWYDFNIYVTMAALVFPRLYFPSIDPALGVLASFATYAVGFVVRPLGGVIFGHIGDRIGRKAALVSTLLIMGISTLAIGFLPTYSQIGVWAPILLIMLRVVQGIGVGGEWGGSVLIAMESGPKEKRGFYASWSGFGVPLSLVIGTTVISLVSSWTGDNFISEGLSAGWRWPFYLSVLLIAVGLYMRTRVEESVAFLKSKAQGNVVDAPVLEVLRKNWRQVLASILLRAGENAPYYVLSSFVLVYSTTALGLSRDFILNCVLGAAVVAMVAVPFFGWLSDRIGQRRTYTIGTVLQLLMIVPYFALMNTANPTVVGFTVVLSLVPWSMQYGPQPAIIAASFPTGLRYSGASLGYQLGSPLWGGLAPLVAIALLSISVWWIAVYVIVLCVISLLAARAIRDNTGDDGAVVLAHEGEARAVAVRS